MEKKVVSIEPMAYSARRSGEENVRKERKKRLQELKSLRHKGATHVQITNSRETPIGRLITRIEKQLS